MDLFFKIQKNEGLKAQIVADGLPKMLGKLSEQEIFLFLRIIIGAGHWKL